MTRRSWIHMTAVTAPSTEPVAGLGEAALFVASTGILFVRQGDSVLDVNVYGQSPDDALELDRQLIEIMLGHL